tara:strand:+ start:354 stop:785 length:432 start_codon:yes stop_codon:yes gene_type:complete
MTKHFIFEKENIIPKSEIWHGFKLVARIPEKQLKHTQNVRSRLQKLISQQILMASDRSYQPTKFKWITDAVGNVRRVAVPIKVKKWWVQTPSGKVHISVIYKGKPLELEFGKNAIEINSLNEVIPTLKLLQKSVDLGDFDNIL